MHPSSLKKYAVFSILMIFATTTWAEQQPAGIIKTLTGPVYIHRDDTRLRAEPEMPVWEKDSPSRDTGKMICCSPPLTIPLNPKITGLKS
jgi:hypothetical protein